VSLGLEVGAPFDSNLLPNVRKRSDHRLRETQAQPVVLRQWDGDVGTREATPPGFRGTLVSEVGRTFSRTPFSKAAHDMPLA